MKHDISFDLTAIPQLRCVLAADELRRSAYQYRPRQGGAGWTRDL